MNNDTTVWLDFLRNTIQLTDEEALELQQQLALLVYGA